MQIDQLASFARRLRLAFLMIVGLPLGTAAQTDRDSTQASQITDPLMVELLNNARVIELDTLLSRASPSDTGSAPGLSARLYVVRSDRSDCSYGGRNCGYRYYIAVSEQTESPAQAVWLIGEFGPFAGVYTGVYLGPSSPGRIQFELSVQPMFPLDHPSNAAADPRGFRIDVGLDSIEITKLD